MEEKEQYFAALNKGDDVASLLINGLPFTSRFIYETVRICVGGFAPRYSLQDLNVADKFVIPKGKAKNSSKSCPQKLFCLCNRI
jgi:hypothetical protein